MFLTVPVTFHTDVTITTTDTTTLHNISPPSGGGKGRGPSKKVVALHSQTFEETEEEIVIG
jgi:hypothetical protein